MTELFTFVLARTSETAQDAARRGDLPGERFHLGSVALVDSLRRDFEEDPRESRELVRFLCRSAARYRRHPEFRREWLLEAR